MSWTAAIPLLGRVIDKIFPDASKATEAKNKLVQMIFDGELEALTLQAGIITSEAQGESWIQRNWRPLVMLIFTALVVCRWMGWSAPNLNPEIELKLFSIIQLGIGGYIASRGIEKVAGTFGKQ